jgi:queuosine precursor transporter
MPINATTKKLREKITQNREKYFLISIYLAAIIAANIIATIFGPKSTIVVSLLFIGLDLTARDRLHEMWHRKNLWRNMLILIAAGSLLSYLINQNSARVAVASLVAFLAVGIIDTIIYSLIYEKKWFVKVNISNVCGAAVDSVIFPTLAFGAFMPLIILGQFLAKTVGGFLWSIVLKKNQTLVKI